MRGLRAALAALVLTVTLPAGAQNAANKSTARALMDDGDRKRDAGDTKGALESYQAADAIMKVPTTGIEVARTLSSMGRLLEAQAIVTQLAVAPAKKEPAAFVAARKAASHLAGDLDARIPTLVVKVVGAGTDTPSLSVDGKRLSSGAASQAQKLDPGLHAIAVRQGTAEKEQNVTLVERDRKTVTVDLTPPPPPPVVVDPPPKKVEEAPSAAPKVLTFGGFGLAAVGIGVGAVTGLMSLKKTNDLKAVCPNDACPPERQADLDSASSLGNVSTIAFVAAGVGAVVGVVGVILWRGQHKETTTSALLVSPSWVGWRATF